MSQKRKSERRKYETNLVTVDPGVKCPRCGERYGHKVTNTYPNGRKRRMCGGCGKPFVAVKGE